MSGSAPSSSAIRTSFDQLIATMLQERSSVSDLVFSPGRAPQIESNGELIELPYPGLECLTPEHTRTLGHLLFGNSPVAAQQIERDGSTDLSYASGQTRFRVNVFKQRST